MTGPTVDNKLDMLMEAILKQQELLKQVLLGFDSILKQVLVQKEIIRKAEGKTPVWMPSDKKVII